MELHEQKLEQSKEMARVINNYPGDYLLSFCELEYADFLEASPVKKKAYVLKESELSADKKQKAKELDLDVLELTGYKMPFEDESIDVIVAAHHLSALSKPLYFLQDVARVLKPGGHFLVLEHNPFCLQTLRILWQEKISKKDLTYSFTPTMRLKSWLKDLSFDIVSSRELKLAKNIFGKAISTDYIMVAEKRAIPLSTVKSKNSKDKVVVGKIADTASNLSKE